MGEIPNSISEPATQVEDRSRARVRTSVRGENDSEPVEGIGAVGAHDAEEWNLTADEKDEECDCRPQHLLAELYLPRRLLHLRHDAAERLDQLEEFDCNTSR